MVLMMVGAAVAAREAKTIKGYVIDNACASAHASELTETAKGHTTACATMLYTCPSRMSEFLSGSPLFAS